LITFWGYDNLSPLRQIVAIFVMVSKKINAQRVSRLTHELPV